MAMQREKRHFYLYEFLPLIECIFTLKYWKGEDMLANDSNLGIYFNQDRKFIKKCFDQAEADGLLILKKRTTKLDEKKIDWAMRSYDLVPSNDFNSKLQEFINSYMLWQPTVGDRMDFFSLYTSKVKKPKEEKVLNRKEVTKMKNNEIWRQEYSWATELLTKINASRPEKFRSTYLNEGSNRETNFLCTTLNPSKSHDSCPPEEMLQYRHVVLSEYFGCDDFEEFDTNGSIYRLSYSIHHNELLSHDIDIYSLFWKEAHFKGRMTKILRDCLKVLCMPAFMSNGAKNGYNSMVVYKEDNEINSKKDWLKKVAINKICSATGLQAREVLDRLSDSMYKVLGTNHFLEEEIFIHESNLHILMITEFMKRNIKVINVYDGFYFSKNSMNQDVFNKVYDQCTRELLKRTSFQ